MTTRVWLNFALLLTVLLLAALVYFEPGKESQARIRLSQIDVAEVQQIKIERDGAETLLFQRGDEQWKMLEPVTVKAKQYYIEELLNILARESLQRYPVTELDLSKYGLQSPRARLWLDDVELDFGSVNPLNNHLYVMIDDVMHMVLQNDISMLTTDWTDYVATAPFATAELVGLQLPGLGEVKHDDQGWHYEGGQAPESADQIQILVDAWQQAQALRVQPAGNSVADKTVIVRFVGDVVMRLGLLSSEDALVLQDHVRGLEYVFDASQSKRLLQWVEPRIDVSDEEAKLD